MKKHLLFFLISISFTIQSVSQCSISTNPTNDCSWGDQINAFTLNAISPGGANSGCGANGYNAFNTPVWKLPFRANQFRVGQHMGGAVG